MKLPGLLMVALLIQVPVFAQDGPNLGQFQAPNSVSDQFPNPAPNIAPQPGDMNQAGQGMRQGRRGRGQGMGRGGGMGRRGMNGGSMGGNGANREQMKQKIMQRFDTNGDGQLDAGERDQLRQMREQRRQAKAAGGGQMGRGQGRMGGRRRQNMGQPNLDGGNPLNAPMPGGTGQP